jgi:hypothetical protein
VLDLCVPDSREVSGWFEGGNTRGDPRSIYVYVEEALSARGLVSVRSNQGERRGAIVISRDSGISGLASKRMAYSQ